MGVKINNMTTIRKNLSFLTIWNISFGFLGIQMAYSLQSANMSRIFQTLGADPQDLGFFWILPPLVGLIIQPIIGALSDKTWNRFGRRLPYLLIGGLTAVVVMIILPNSGNLGLTVSQALWFGAVILLFMDLSSNVAMQPFKMLIGDMVNKNQKQKAYSIQSFLLNIGSVLASIFPYTLTAIGISDIATNDEIPDSVKFSFYFGAVILVLCCTYTFLTVKEIPPKEYNKYHGITQQDIDNSNDKKRRNNIFVTLKKSPKIFWTVGIVQFFCWAGFLYLWNYGTGGIAEKVWKTVDAQSSAFQAAGNWFGIMSAAQSIAAVLWSFILSRINNNSKKFFYSLSVLLGGVGFVSMFFITQQYLLIGSFILIGIAWAAMMTFPLTFLTNALDGKKIGTYLGLFNGTICLPQIISAAFGKLIFNSIGKEQSNMLLIAGVFLLIGAISVWFIKEEHYVDNNNK
jgi:maltose/moltooligosaccharide transporter